MLSLEVFQKEMTQALSDSSVSVPGDVVEQQSNCSRRFDIYRNNRAVSLVENLRAAYPLTEQLLGEAYFTAVARGFIDTYPPSGPVMSEYGEHFAAFLKTLPAIRKLAYVPDIARVEWACGLAFHAKDARPLQLHDLALLAAGDLTQRGLQRHHGTYLIQSRWPIASIRERMLDTGENKKTVDMTRAESVLIFRPYFDVHTVTLMDDTAEFFNALLTGVSIEAAATVTLEKHLNFDAGTALSELVQMGVFMSVTHVKQEQQ